MTNNLSPSTQKQAESRIDVMERIFSELHGLFGNQFLDKYRTGQIIDGKDTGIENTKAVWIDKIAGNGLRLSEIKRGMNACQRAKYPPSWSEFLEYCRPTPNVDAAIVEAVEQLQARRDGKDVWSHPAIYWAAMKVGYHEMTNLPHGQLRPRFEAALSKVMEGEVQPIPTITQAPRIAHAPVSAEQIAESKAMIADATRKIVHGGSTGLQWAHRILAREARGDKNVSLYQVREAQQAIANGCEP